MATYCNQHWLLSHIRNSFISTDDTGICETVMVSDDLPKHYLRKYQGTPTNNKTFSGNNAAMKAGQPLSEVDYICYPGLDQSDDEDIDLSAQSFEIQMYPEVGAHRFRSNTAQKLEKMDIARRRAARTKCVNYDDEIVAPESSDFFEKKTLKPVAQSTQAAAAGDDPGEFGNGLRSKLAEQLANAPKQAQNKFMEYARFDGTSQTGMQTKRINVFLNMLPERERNYPIKICVIASAKIIEVIGLICYTATVKFPDIPLKSIRHYALYMTEDNDDLEDFPPLDNREPCSKFGFSHLTLAERRPLVPVTRMDYHLNHQHQHGNLPTKSVNSEEENSRLTVSLLENIDMNAGSADDEESSDIAAANDMLEAPVYRTFQLHIIDKRFFKTEVTLGISGERIEIDQHKNAKFWTKQKAVTYPIDAIAFCEIVERRNSKAVVRIWLRSSSSFASSTTTLTGAASSNFYLKESSNLTVATPTGNAAPHSPSSPSHYSSPFSFFSSSGSAGHHRDSQHHIRFKHYDFEAETQKAEQILNKLNCILRVRSSEVRREFISLRERKMVKSQAKKHLKM